MEYRSGNHTVCNLAFHFAWTTRYRHQVLTGEVALRAKELIRQFCMSRDIAIVRGTVSKDYIHLVVSCPPSMSPAKMIRHLKAWSSKLLYEEFPHLAKRYRGLWGRGYFCATVGAVTDELIIEFVENQQVEGSEEAFTIQD